MADRGSRPVRLHLGLMLAMTFSTGVVDAVGYLGLDRVFTGNMTGNVVILAMALTGADGLPVLGPVVALLLFLVGATVAGRVLRDRPAGWTRRTTGLFAGVALLLGVVAAVSFTLGSQPGSWTAVLAGMLGLAMGCQAGTARHLAVAEVTTVVVTSTLVGLAFDSWFGRGASGHPWVRRVGAVLLLGVGAATGALLLRFGMGWPATCAASIAAAVAVIGAIGHPPRGRVRG